MLSIVSATSGMPDGVSAKTVETATRAKRKARTAVRMGDLYNRIGAIRKPLRICRSDRLIRVARPVVKSETDLGRHIALRPAAETHIDPLVGMQFGNGRLA